MRRHGRRLAGDPAPPDWLPRLALTNRGYTILSVRPSISHHCGSEQSSCLHVRRALDWSRLSLLLTLLLETCQARTHGLLAPCIDFPAPCCIMIVINTQHILLSCILVSHKHGAYCSTVHHRCCSRSSLMHCSMKFSKGANELTN